MYVHIFQSHDYLYQYCLLYTLRKKIRIAHISLLKKNRKHFNIYVGEYLFSIAIFYSRNHISH